MFSQRKIQRNIFTKGNTKEHFLQREIQRGFFQFLKISQRTVEKEFVSMASMNSWVYEADIGKLCSFLISTDSMRISCQIIVVDGNATRLD